MFSTTNTDSELYKLNHANGQPFTVSSETANLIQEGIHYSELSGGAFDLTIESVSALWNFKADKPTVPSSDAIAQAVSHVDYTKIDIQDNTVTLEDPEAGIDLGAIAKGYIADQVKTYLKKQGINMRSSILEETLMSSAPNPTEANTTSESRNLSMNPVKLSPLYS